MAQDNFYCIFFYMKQMAQHKIIQQLIVKLNYKPSLNVIQRPLYINWISQKVDKF